MERDEIIDFMVFLALRAGSIQKTYYGKPYATEWEKQHMRTEIDRKIGEMVRKEIATMCPEFTVLSEELPDKQGNNMVFVVDEIDGTNPYFRRFSDHFGFSIGLCEGTTPVAGVVYAPKRNELYVGSEKEALCEDEPIKPSHVTTINKVWMTFCSGKDNRDSHLPYLQRAMLEDGISGTVEFGCASVTLCLVACGKLDAFLGTSLESEDMAGAVPILKAAGAKVTNLQGKEWRLGDKSIFAANPVLHEKLCEFFQLG